MPGPVSDAYDPEFGTASNAETVREALLQVRHKVTRILGTEHLEDILQVARRAPCTEYTAEISDRDLRLIRFALARAAECV